MVDVRTQILISRPIGAVAGYACDPDNVPHWYVNIRSVEWKTPKPLTVGSQIAFSAHFLGRTLSYIYEVVEMGENKFVMRTAEGPFPMETSYLFDAVDENTTKMTLRNRGEPTGFSVIFAPLMSLMMRRANNKDLRKLKEILEGEAV